jgi:putative DNA primase/helicase
MLDSNLIDEFDAARQQIDIEARRSSLTPPFALPGVVLACGSDLTPEPVEWLWSYWLALGKVHILAGAPGQGKTTLAVAMAAIVTFGGRWPDGTHCEAGNVVVWSGEDDSADTLLPRFLAAGGDRSRIFFVQGTRDDGGVHPFDPARDMPQLVAAIREVGGAKLVIVDPVVSAVTGDSHKNTEVRRALQPLVDAAADCRFAVLGITHFSKSGAGQDPTQRVIGSVAFSAVARVVLVAARVTHEDGTERRILARSKSNIGPDSGGFEYELEQVEALPGIEASRVRWIQAVEGTARDLLAEQPDSREQAGPSSAAAEFLRDLLAPGMCPSAAVKREAEVAGISWITVRRAADKLGVIRRKGGMNTGWYWSLPSAEDAHKNAEEVEPAHKKNVNIFEHVRTEVSTFGRGCAAEVEDAVVLRDDVRRTEI